MFFVLPLATGGLQNLIDRIDLTTLHRQLHFLDKRDVLVSIPKFSFKLKASYTDVLKQVKMEKTQDVIKFLIIIFLIVGTSKVIPEHRKFYWNCTRKFHNTEKTGGIRYSAIHSHRR